VRDSGSDGATGKWTGTGQVVLRAFSSRYHRGVGVVASTLAERPKGRAWSDLVNSNELATLSTRATRNNTITTP
jgi:hypothetical protein